MLQLVGLRTLLMVGFLAIWEVVSGRLVSTFFISKPSLIFATLWSWLLDGSLFYHSGITAGEALLGFLVGGTVGMSVGLILGRSTRLADVINPFITAFYSLPKLALAPLFILWFGIGFQMKVSLVATIVFFLVFLNTYTGVRDVSRELTAILRLMGARERHLLSKVVIPSAIIWVFAGLRISAPYALVGAVVGELVASNRGLGYLLVHAAGQFDTAGVFAALVAIVLLSYLLNAAVGYCATRAMPWRNVEGAQEMTI
ncbi:MAG: ABC transporter permease [Dongiaceae bacterium]